MKIFCTDRVKQDILKLGKKSSYSNLNKLLFDYISEKNTLEEWKSGSRIYLGNPNFICIKKRLGGSGGYRMYYLLTIKGDEITIAAIYPKTGSKGGSDLSDFGKTACIGEALDQITEANRWHITLDIKGETVKFEKERKEDEKVKMIG